MLIEEQAAATSSDTAGTKVETLGRLMSLCLPWKNVVFGGSKGPQARLCRPLKMPTERKRRFYQLWSVAINIQSNTQPPPMVVIEPKIVRIMFTS
jgi:hypothetical protein